MAPVVGLAWVLCGCMTGPYDGQRIEGRASPIGFAGFHPVAGMTVSVEADVGGRWERVATGTSGTTSLEADRDLFRWSAEEVVLPPPAWVPGFRGYEARVRARDGEGRFQASVREDYLSCYLRVGRDLMRFPGECSAPASPSARVQTADYVPFYSGLGDAQCAYGSLGCGRCANDVEGTFAALGHRRVGEEVEPGLSGKLRFYANVGRRLPPEDAWIEDLDDFRHHIEGFARVPGVGSDHWFVASYLSQKQSSGLLLVQLRDLSGHGGERIIAPTDDPVAYYRAPGRGRGVVALTPVPGTHHTGGLQALGRVVFVPSEMAGLDVVEIYDLRDPMHPARIGKVTLGTTSAGRRVGAAHHVAAARMESGHYVLLVNRSNGGVTDVYVSASTHLEDGPAWLRVDSRDFHALSARWNTSKNTYQNVNFVTDCASGQLYLVALMQDDRFGSPWNANNHVDLFRAPAVDGRLTLEHVARRKFGRHGNSCEMRGGASVHVTPSGEMIVYCSSGWSDHDQLRLAELTAPRP